MLVPVFMCLTFLLHVSASWTPTPRVYKLHDSDKVDLREIFSDPSIESRLTVSKQSLVDRPRKTLEMIASRQMTRSGLAELGDRKRTRALHGLGPRASPIPVARCPQDIYNLEVQGLAFYSGQIWNAPRIVGPAIVKTVGECYSYCLSQSACRAFLWYPQVASGAGYGHCRALDGEDTSVGWTYRRGLSVPYQAGTYFLDGRCLAGKTCCSPKPWSGFPTCPGAGGDSPLAGTAHFQNWHSYNNLVASKSSTSREDCRDFCKQYTGYSGCFGYVYSPAETTCWLKAGPDSPSKYLESNWAFNDGHSRGVNGGYYMLNATCDAITANVPSAAMESCCDN